MTLWVVRAGRDGEAEDYALENKCVVVGWTELPDLSSAGDRDELGALLARTYQDESESTRLNWVSQLWAFAHKIAPGDLVALPKKTTGTIAFGRVIGPYRYVSTAPEWTEHQIPVEWIDTDVSRQRIDQDLLYSINGAMTVFRVRRNNAEARIHHVLGIGPPETALEARPSLDETDDGNADDDIRRNLRRDAASQILELVGRKFKGHELERLVEEVLIAQGFTTDRTGKGADGGVDIVAGQGPLGLNNPRLCVQVKSGDNPVDVAVLRELQGTLAQFGADLGLIVAWGGFKQSVIREGRRLFFQVRLWSAEDLIANLQEVYDDLPRELQNEIPLTRIFTLVEDDES